MESLSHVGQGSSVVHIVDDDFEVRKALSLVLRIAGHSVRVHQSARDFLTAIEEHAGAGGCVITDVRMPDMSGIELMQAMAARNISLPTIVITAYAEVPLAVQAMKLGAVDFLEKPFDTDVVVDSVSRALRRPETAAQGETERIRARLKTLSRRERDVLSGLLEGRLNKTIAYDLGISPRTVEVHRARIMEKMQTNNFPQLLRTLLLLPAE